MSIAIIDADPDISIIVLLGEKNRISKQFFKKNQKTPRRNSKRNLKKNMVKRKMTKDEIGNIRLNHVFTSL